MTKKNPIYGQGWNKSEIQEIDTQDPWHERYKDFPHYDRRPRGHNNGDDSIWEKVCDALTNAYDVNPAEIEVDVFNKVVFLLGFVQTHKEAWRAEQITWNIPGVEDVKNNIKIRDTL